MKASERRLLLIPWHIGNRLDVTVHAARVARSVRLFLAEEPGLTRRQFEADLGIDCRDKQFLLIPEREDPRFLETVLAGLRREDVGLVCSGGIPCFIDPGAWVVAALRRQKVAISALAGPSILSTLLSLSGVDWTGRHPRGTFVIYHGAPGGRADPRFQEAVGRREEPVFVFLNIHQFKACLAELAARLGGRLVSAFFDLTKSSGSKYPYADRVITLDCRAWLEEAERLPWAEISDVALMLHPEGEP